MAIEITNVVAFDADRLKSHCSGIARCVGCKHEWAAVVPHEYRNNYMECPSCGDMRGRYFWGYVPGPGNVGKGSALFCECGNDLFFVLPDGHKLCANCAKETE